MPIRPLLALLATTLLAACATPQPCTPTPLGLLQCQAERGDKAAQLRLGKLYETGLAVPQDYARAAQLYRAAGQFTSGTTYIYSPPVGKSPGRVMPINTGMDRAGLAEAKYRLALLYAQGLGVKHDSARARELMAEAMKMGWRPL